jgi:hypothetical protein
MQERREEMNKNSTHEVLGKIKKMSKSHLTPKNPKLIYSDGRLYSLGNATAFILRADGETLRELGVNEKNTPCMYDVGAKTGDFVYAPSEEESIVNAVEAAEKLLKMDYKHICHQAQQESFFQFLIGSNSMIDLQSFGKFTKPMLDFFPTCYANDNSVYMTGRQNFTDEMGKQRFFEFTFVVAKIKNSEESFSESGEVLL